MLLTLLTLSQLLATPAQALEFPTIQAELKSKAISHPAILIDLDQVDRNIAQLVKTLPPRIRYRAVDKSLPSLELLKYVMEKTGSHRLMAFHHPFLPVLIRELPADTDILMGKPMPAQAVREVIQSLDEKSRRELARRVTWLIDTPRLMDETVAVYREAGLPMRASIEIDVGMHRGGTADLTEFDAVLERARAAKPTVTVTGLMGYDGHALHFPLPEALGLKALSARMAVRGVERRYREFKARLTLKYSDVTVPASELVFNGGGSTTYSLYGPDAELNEVSVGSAILKPRDFDVFSLEAHQPAVYIGTPVLKKVPHGELAFIGELQGFFNGIFRPHHHGFYVYGGNWSEIPVYPAGLSPHPLAATTPNRNLISNQSYLVGSAPDGFGVGDWVFYRPNESDEIFLFEEIQLLRGGHIVGTWKPYPRRY